MWWFAWLFTTAIIRRDFIKKFTLVLTSILLAFSIEPICHYGTLLLNAEAGASWDKRIKTVPPPVFSQPKPKYKIKSKRKSKRMRFSLGKFKVTAYCPCRKCSEGYGNRTATGVRARQGRTVAVDPKVMPYGTRIYIKGMGEFVAEDCGGGVKGKHIDIYFESHQETVKFGVKYKKVERRG